MDYSVLELLLYHMWHGQHHVAHHAAQLNLLLRQHVNDAPRRWAEQNVPGDGA
jgi:hypothetical protein